MRKMAKTFPFIPAILCGGSGSRLWPRSRAALPKPFIAMPDGGGALIDRAYARIARAPVRPDAVMTIVSADYGFLCEESFAAHGPDVPHWIVAEPVARDTAPATAMAAEICRQRLGDNAVLLVLPADHMIADADGFWKSALRAMESAAAGKFSLLGIAPDYAATGYGYIQRGEKIGEGLFFRPQICGKTGAGAGGGVFKKRRPLLECGGVLLCGGDFAFRAARNASGAGKAPGAGDPRGGKV